MTRCMVRPCVARGSLIWRCAVLHQCIYHLGGQAISACRHGSPDRTMVLRVTISLRITAVMTSLLGLPFFWSLLAKSRMTGLGVAPLNVENERQALLALSR